MAKVVIPPAPPHFEVAVRKPHARNFDWLEDWYDNEREGLIYLGCAMATGLFAEGYLHYFDAEHEEARVVAMMRFWWKERGPDGLEEPTTEEEAEAEEALDQAGFPH